MKKEYKYYDPTEDLNFTFKGKLPHCHQEYTYQFISFRLADSLPREHTKELRDELEGFKKLYPLPWNNEVKRLYSKILGPMQERLLDNGYGCCALKYPEIRKILIDSIHFKEDKDYDVIAYVIMPNHVHLIMVPFEKKLSLILQSIKGFTGNMINKAMKRHGEFWMRESFDRMPRHEKDLWRQLRYIRDNPKYLPEGTYTLYFKEGYDPRI